MDTLSTAAFENARTAFKPQPSLTAANAKNVKDARKAAEEFEGFFISQFLEEMFRGIKTDGPFGGGQAENIYRSLMVQEYGKSIAANGGLGIADSVYRSIIELQEKSQ